MGAAEVEGVQSQGVGVSVKHFAMNNSENYRFIGNSIPDSTDFPQKGNCETGRIFLFQDAPEQEKSSNGGLTPLADAFPLDITVEIHFNLQPIPEIQIGDVLPWNHFGYCLQMEKEKSRTSYGLE